MRLRLAVLASLLVLTACGDRGDPAAAALAARADLETALRPAALAEFRALPPLPFVDIEARLDPDGNRLVGVQRTWLANTGGETLADIALRCPANATAFNGASLAIEAASWDGRPLPAAQRSADGTGLTWSLPRPLPPGGSGLLETRFTATVSTANGFHGLMARQGSLWSLYHWHPELPLRRDGAWFLPPVSGIGDESQAVLAHVRARLTVPAGMQVIAGGADAARVPAEPGWETVTIACPASRNLAVVLARDLVCASGDAGGVRVRSWHDPAHPRSGGRALRVAVASLRLFDRSFGSYPWNELDVVETAQGDDVGGMESTGLVLIDGRSYAGSEDKPLRTGPEDMHVLALETAVAHEVGHQWWYSLVGNDAFNEPWLDESLTNWSGGWALEVLYGDVGRRQSVELNAMSASLIPGGMTRRIDLPLPDYGGMTTYGAVVYARGTLLYERLRRQMGHARFIAWLRAWQETHRFGIATGADWRAALAAALGPEEAARFIAKWVEGRSAD